MSDVIILADLGTGFVKINTATAEHPIKSKSKAGIPRYSSESETDFEKYKFDEHILTHQGILETRNIYSSIQIYDRSIFDKYLYYVFGKFSTIIEDSTLILGVSSQWSTETINSVLTFLFQKFNFQKIVCAPSTMFSLYYYNLQTCTVVDLGYDQTRIIQYKNRQPVGNTAKITEIAGKSVDEYLLSLLQTKFSPIRNKPFQKLVEEIKTTKTLFAEDFEASLQSKNPVLLLKETITIPNFNESLVFGIEKYLVPEFLFRPVLGNSQFSAVDHLLIESLRETTPSLRRELFQTIVVIGGSSKFPLFIQRFKQDFRKIPLLAGANIMHDSRIADLIPWFGMKKFVEQGLHNGMGKTQTDFFAKL